MGGQAVPCVAGATLQHRAVAVAGRAGLPVDPKSGGSAVHGPVVASANRPYTAPAPVAPAPSPVIDADQMADLNAVYQEAGVPDAAFTAEQALDVLNELDADQPEATKRLALRGVLKSLGRTNPALTAESVAEDARLKTQALTHVVDLRAAKLGQFVSDTEREIATLKEEIMQRLKAIEVRRLHEQQLTQRCRDHAERLKKVAEYLRPTGA
jgi:hypothetical protein